MDDISQYWTFLHLTAAGTPQRRTIDSTRTWLEREGSDRISRQELPHRDIQRWLKAHQAEAAEACLRCFISHQIVYACQDLEAGFGKRHGVSRYDLLHLVLDDTSLIRDRPQSSYQSFASKVLDSFDPQQSSLSTWTIRLVRQHSEVNAVLLEHGVYLVSDWAILNDTKPSQLEASGMFHLLSAVEMSQASALLEGYNAVYRSDRWRQKQKQRVGRCAPPSTDQLQRIAAYLADEYSLSLSANQVMQQLQSLAQQLRALRIHNRSKVLPTDSLDNPDQAKTLNSLSATDASSDDVQADVFLGEYRQQFLSSLDDALKTVVEQRVSFLGRRKGDRPQRFLKGLHLFHCLGEAMKDIAPKIGYIRQDQVTALLKLKPLRTDVRHQMLQLLRDRILLLAKTFTNAANLQDLDQRLAQALDEEITDLIHETEVETSVRRNGPLKSRFARHLCRYLDTRI